MDQSLRQLATADARHHHVGDQQVDLAVVVLRDEQGFCAVCGFQQRIAAAAQNLRAEVPHRGFVFHQQQRLVARPLARGPILWDLWIDRLVRTRQIDLKRRALAGRRFDADEAAALPDDAVDGGQTQPRALARFFGGEEGLEQARAHLVSHAAAGVGDREHHVVVRRKLGADGRRGGAQLDALGAQKQRAAGGHGVARIDHEV